MISDSRLPSPDLQISLLTAGRDKPYALGLAAALAAEGISLDFIGSDGLDGPELHSSPRIRILNLRGDQRVEAGAMQKVRRVVSYYWKLLRYAATARPKVFHILWNNKFEVFDRTLLMLYYKLLGKRLVFTAHNVNAGKRDGRDTGLNRLTLRIQYRLADHIFVHTEMMKGELLSEFNVPDDKVSVIPFGINNTLPTTSLTPAQARQQIGLEPQAKVMLFFGNIAPYKGLEFFAEALALLSKSDDSYRIIIAGQPKGCQDYWEKIQSSLREQGLSGRVIERIEYIPDEKVEVYFKAADLLILPYTHIFQSGVLFLGYSFGLPVVATDVGSLREGIKEGETGFVCRPRDAADLATSIENYFSTDLYRHLDRQREVIKQFANERYSWAKVARMSRSVYSNLLSSGRA